jgi:hypothetical protein
MKSVKQNKPKKLEKETKKNLDLSLSAIHSKNHKHQMLYKSGILDAYKCKIE